MNTGVCSKYECGVCKLVMHNVQSSKIKEHKGLCHRTPRIKKLKADEVIKPQKKKKVSVTKLLKSKDSLIKRLTNENSELRSKLNRLEHEESPRYAHVDPFFISKEWRKLRYRALTLYGHKCACCKTTKGVMHVDHIKPRSRYPELALEFDNLQILCESCNLGKSNLDETDWRAHKQ